VYLLKIIEGILSLATSRKLTNVFWDPFLFSMLLPTLDVLKIHHYCYCCAPERPAFVLLWSLAHGKCLKGGSQTPSI
jgi:hypothetical protein